MVALVATTMWPGVCLWLRSWHMITQHRFAAFMKNWRRLTWRAWLARQVGSTAYTCLAPHLAASKLRNPRPAYTSRTIFPRTTSALMAFCTVRAQTASLNAATCGPVRVSKAGRHREVRTSLRYEPLPDGLCDDNSTIVPRSTTPLCHAQPYARMPRAVPRRAPGSLAKSAEVMSAFVRGRLLGGGGMLLLSGPFYSDLHCIRQVVLCTADKAPPCYDEPSSTT